MLVVLVVLVGFFKPVDCLVLARQGLFLKVLHTGFCVGKSLRAVR